MTYSRYSKSRISTLGTALIAFTAIYAPGCDRVDGSGVESSAGGTPLHETGDGDHGAETGGSGSGGAGSGGSVEVGTGAVDGSGGFENCGSRYPFVSCSDGELVFGLTLQVCLPVDPSWGTTSHTCLLGCREEGVFDPQELGADTVYDLCEELSIRREGFPCTDDIDCISPIDAAFESNLTGAQEGLGGEGGMGVGLGGSSSVSLGCGPMGSCRPEEPKWDGMGESCSGTTSASQEGPALVRADTCSSGGCVVSEGGETAGTCTVGCISDPDCPDGHRCADVLDDRYTVWGTTQQDVPPPRVTVCLPG